MSSLRAVPSTVQADATCHLIFTGPPNVAVGWAITGAGALEDAATHTNSAGVASAKYVPETDDATVSVTVTFGAGA